MARILVVEDEEHIARGLQFNLEAEGHDVSLAANGAAAAERLECADGRWDLVILDLMLPGMSGFEVARRARAAPIRPTPMSPTVRPARRWIEPASGVVQPPFRMSSSNETMRRSRASSRVRA